MNEWKSRVPTWAWAFLALLGLAVAFFIISLLTANTPDEPPAASASAEQTTETTPPPSPSTTASDPNESICGLPAGDQSIPEEAPETQWELVNGYAVPTSEEFGPGLVEDGQLRCFAHNPTGALFAAARSVAFSNSSSQEGRKFLSDPNQVKFVSDEARDKALSESSNSDEPVPMRIRGFKLQQNSEDNIVVWLALDISFDSNSATFKLPMEMSWENGDWIFVYPTYITEAEPVDSLVSENFIPWSGVN